MSRRIYLYPLWLRIWHWSNALLFLVLIATGVSMHYASLDKPLVPFETAIAVHNVSGVALALLY
ncbi:MAG: cytochrome B, partial [Candidatus Zixiibacteriota bacterium]